MYMRDHWNARRPRSRQQPLHEIDVIHVHQLYAVPAENLPCLGGESPIGKETVTRAVTLVAEHRNVKGTGCRAQNQRVAQQDRRVPFSVEMGDEIEQATLASANPVLPPMGEQDWRSRWRSGYRSSPQLNSPLRAGCRRSNVGLSAAAKAVNNGFALHVVGRTDIEQREDRWRKIYRLRI